MIKQSIVRRFCYVNLSILSSSKYYKGSKLDKVPMKMSVFPRELITDNMRSGIL